MLKRFLLPMMFQHTAARRRLALNLVAAALRSAVSTHSRPKAAGLVISDNPRYRTVSTHSRPKAAGTASKALVAE